MDFLTKAAVMAGLTLFVMIVGAALIDWAMPDAKAIRDAEARAWQKLPRY